MTDMGKEITLEQHTIILYGNPSAKDWIIQPVNEHEEGQMDAELQHLCRLTGGMELFLIAYRVEDWNRELSPWEAPAVFGDQAFGCGAKDTLHFLTETVISYLQQLCGEGREHTLYLAGYSLAGLFALWAAYQTDIFAGVAGVSPSVWFPGWTDYAKQNRPGADAIYLSLGDKEERTRNPQMATVGDAIRRQKEILREQNIPCMLEWNPGNHFREGDLRMAKGIAALLKELI